MYAIYLRRKKNPFVRPVLPVHAHVHKHRYAHVILLWIVQRRRRRYRSAKCRDRPCYYIILYAEQLHSIIAAVAAAAAVFTRLIVSWKSRPRRLRPFIYLYFNFFSPPLPLLVRFGI